MMSLWTGGATRVGGHSVAKTNLFDPAGPLTQLCGWGEAQRPRLTVRGHCMVYYQDYTPPTFPAGQPPLFVRGEGGIRVFNPSYTPGDLRDMLRSYVRLVVDATLAQNAAARARHRARVIEMWDVTNEAVSEGVEVAVPLPLGFAYRADDPWYNNGPKDAGGYDYVNDIYRESNQAKLAHTLAMIKHIRQGEGW